MRNRRVRPLENFALDEYQQSTYDCALRRLNLKRISFLISVTALFVSACGGAKPNLPDTNALSTQIAATVNAAINNVLPTSGPNVVPTKASIVPPPEATKAPIVPPSAATKAPKTPTNNSGGSFSPITFAIGENNYEPVDVMDTFPDGVTSVYAFFNAVNIPKGTKWQSQWFVDGTETTKLKDHIWDLKPNDVNWLVFFVTDNSALDAGEYELKLTIDGKVVQSGQFTIEQNGELDFGAITFAAGVDKNDQPVDPVSTRDPTFPAGTKEVYAFFSGLNVPKGTDWQSQWFVNGESAIDPTNHTWNLGSTEQNWISFFNQDKSPLDPGTFEVKLTIDGTVVNIGSFVVSAK
jgi:hypothetical protein